MEFWKLYNGLTKEAKKELKQRILYATGVSYSTFYTWKNRKKVPKYEQTIISSLIKEKVEILFPVNNWTNENKTAAQKYNKNYFLKKIQKYVKQLQLINFQTVCSCFLKTPVQRQT